MLREALGVPGCWKRDIERFPREKGQSFQRFPATLFAMRNPRRVLVLGQSMWMARSILSLRAMRGAVLCRSNN